MLNAFLRNSFIYALIGFSSLTAYAVSCNPSPTAIRSAPDSRYTIMTDGTEVKDKRTGLIWQRCGIGKVFDGRECVGRYELFGWKRMLLLDEALKKGVRVDKYTSKNYRVSDTLDRLDRFGNRLDASLNNGHRVPTIEELESLIEIACSEVAINTTAFPNTDHVYMSSTPDADNEDRSLHILFLYNMNGKRYHYTKQNSISVIRLVRSE